MTRLADLCRVLAAISALVLAIALFHGPILGLMPAAVSEVASRLPGLSASRGFVAQILSDPPGAEVRIDGAARGTTPFFGNVTCRADEPVLIEVEAPGFKIWRRELPCREGGTLQATARLEK